MPVFRLGDKRGLRVQLYRIQDYKGSHIILHAKIILYLPVAKLRTRRAHMEIRVTLLKISVAGPAHFEKKIEWPFVEYI